MCKEPGNGSQSHRLSTHSVDFYFISVVIAIVYTKRKKNNRILIGLAVLVECGCVEVETKITHYPFVGFGVFAMSVCVDLFCFSLWCDRYVWVGDETGRTVAKLKNKKKQNWTSSIVSTTRRSELISPLPEPHTYTRTHYLSISIQRHLAYVFCLSQWALCANECVIKNVIERRQRKATTKNENKQNAHSTEFIKPHCIIIVLSVRGRCRHNLCVTSCEQIIIISQIKFENKLDVNVSEWVRERREGERETRMNVVCVERHRIVKMSKLQSTKRSTESDMRDC